VVGPPDDFPRVAMVADVPPPRQCFEADSDARIACEIAQRVKVSGRSIDAAERRWRDVGADQHEVGAQRVHHLELALGAFEGAAAQRLGEALEIAERLEQRDREAEIARHLPDLGGTRAIGQQIVLEDLDPVEPRGRDRLELFAEVAADRHGRYRCSHPAPPYELVSS
jgi:hypothetical protein